MANTEVLDLTSGRDHCEIVPSLGGSIAGWTVDGQTMMRGASVAALTAADPFGMASFPLVPYSNRIGDGRFEWAGRPFKLAPNFLPEPHAIHGVGFTQPWSPIARSAGSLTLELLHRPGAGWPWPFRARQQIALADGALTLELQAVNLADQPVPLAFGHHPYFPRAGATLQFRARGVWLVGDDGLPALRVPPFDQFDFSAGKSVERGSIDHCFSGWSGAAHVAWRDQPWSLDIEASSSLPCAVVCLRPDLDGFCFEPVPHANDAINRLRGDSPMPVIEPGGEFRAWIRFRAVPAGHPPAAAGRPSP
jgi:aldose 1-epimerase